MKTIREAMDDAEAQRKARPHVHRWVPIGIDARMRCKCGDERPIPATTADPPKRKAPRKKWKTVPQADSPGSAFETARMEIQSLAEEMEEWEQSLSSNDMEGMPIYDTVAETAETLQEAAGELESIDTDPLDGMPEVMWTESHKYGRRGDPRWMRLSNAIAAINAVKDAINELPDELDEDDGAYGEPCNHEGVAEGDSCQECEDKRAEVDSEWEEKRDALRNIGDEIEQATDALDSVEFPGMYGG